MNGTNGRTALAWHGRGVLVVVLLSVVAMPSLVWALVEAKEPHYRGLLGPNSRKVKVEDGKTLLWAGENQWYDFSGSPIPTAELQFGIGKDRIPSIDDPLFVSADDPRLLGVPVSPYRGDEKPKTTDDIMVIGYKRGGDVRAYPTALLDRHELVNDRIGGKPVTVGW